MRLARKTHYGIQMVIFLGTQPAEWYSLSTIADELDIPLSFLKHIAIALKRHRLVKSLGGARGGYQLSKPLTEITLGMIFRSLDESLNLMPCVRKNCRHETCVTGRFWAGVTANLSDVFDRTNLQQVWEVGQSR